MRPSESTATARKPSVRAQKQQQGVVLFIVLFFTLLLTASIATFIKRATVDSLLSRNREAMARTEALARGGIALAKAILIQDRIADTANATNGGRLDSLLDVWARAGGAPIDAGDGATLRLEIEDSGARFNLNSLFEADTEAGPNQITELFLVEFMQKIIEELPPEIRALYDARELVENLTDYIDPDETRVGGGFEDDYYQKQSPPYRSANRPLLSVDELALIEGFDAEIVDRIRPYVTVYPFANGGGINPNTAPAHILSLIFYNDGIEFRLAKEDDVRRILEAREAGLVFCPEQTLEQCTDLADILPNTSSIFPPLSYFSDVFTVRSVAEFSNVRRTVEAVLDRSPPSQPLLLSWKVR